MVAPTYVTRKMQICSLVIEISNPACSLKILVSVITHSAPSGLKTALLVNVESSAPVPSGLLTRLYSSQNLDPYYTCRDVCDDVKLQKKLKKKTIQFAAVIEYNLQSTTSVHIKKPCFQCNS